MLSLFPFRSLIFPAALVALFAIQLQAQSKSSGPGPSAPKSTTSSPNGTSPTNVDDSRQPVFFVSGRVAFDDGSPISSGIAIERVCGGSSHVEGYADSKGRFSFQLGNKANSVVQDASVANDSDGRFGGSAGGATNTAQLTAVTNPVTQPSGQGLTERSISMCDLRAAFPGYRSDNISLLNRKSLDNPDVGTLILHRLGTMPGSTVSVNSAAAPKPAQKAYEKAMQQASKGNFDAAEANFARAIDIYPQYASAWFELGKIRQSQRKFGEAREAYLKATRADAKYATPYEGLAQISVEQGNWSDVITFSGRAVALDPVELPNSWFLNALGYWCLHQYEQAGKSAQETIKLDSGHRFPMAELILATACAGRADYTSELQHLHAYLSLVSEGKNADLVRQRITELEQQSATAKK